jgi:hypothetical protein
MTGERSEGKGNEGVRRKGKGKKEVEKGREEG